MTRSGLEQNDKRVRTVLCNDWNVKQLSIWLFHISCSIWWWLKI